MPAEKVRKTLQWLILRTLQRWFTSRTQREGLDRRRRHIAKGGGEGGGRGGGEGEGEGEGE